MNAMNAQEETQTILDEKEVGRILRVSPAGMCGWRAKGEGPPWFKLGKRLVRYDLAALRAWIAAQASQERE